jgi:HPt (histidine-containing phosphotransfer) domain-containing protein
MNTITAVDALGRIAGFDATIGLRITAGDGHRYLGALHRFVALYGHGLRGIEAAPRAQMQQEARRLAVACSAVGAAQLAAQASALERHCRGGSDLPHLAGEAFDLDEALIRFADALRWALTDLQQDTAQ